jgi:hypothetical protein
MCDAKKEGRDNLYMKGDARNVQGSSGDETVFIKVLSILSLTLKGMQKE